MTSGLLALAACGGAQPDTVASRGAAQSNDSAPSPAPPVTLYATTTVVLESPQHGPQLCLGGVATSLPPQCGGPEVIGWDWNVAEGEESALGTTWGDYSLRGTWDGKAFTLTEPPRPPETKPPEPPTPPFTTPCPEPAGGWKVIDPSRTTQKAMDRARAYAAAQPTAGGVWVDQSIDPTIDEASEFDLTKLILNFSFTGDLVQHEKAIRRLWGGALCVSLAPVSAARLRQIRAEVEAEVPNFVSSATDDVHGHVELGVLADDGLQKRFDERYGKGVVKVVARLYAVPL